MKLLLCLWLIVFYAAIVRLERANIVVKGSDVNVIT